jgi:hypothetical protein
MATSAATCRPVLMDKTTNASLQSWAYAEHNKPVPITKASTFEHLQRYPITLPREASSIVGRKRSFAQVDGAEEDTRSISPQQEHPTITKLEDEAEVTEKEKIGKESVHDQVIRDSVEEKKEEQEKKEERVEEKEDDENESSAATSKAITSALSSSFHAPQEGPVPIEEQFVILDEASQNTVDNLVCE